MVDAIVFLCSNNNVHVRFSYPKLECSIQSQLPRSNLLGIEEQELSVLLTHIFNVHFGARDKGDVDTITLPQLDRITTNVDLGRSASGCTSVIAGPLNEVGVNVFALSGVGEGNSRGENGSENVKRRVDRGRAGGLTFIHNLGAVPNSRCDNVRPSVLFAFIGEMSK